MRKTRTIKRLAFTLLIIAGNFLLSACSPSPSSPLDQAYYTDGGGLSIPGGYTRSIFSSHNF